MRYSFHGKVRANGQQVDGFVEAANATEAIDRLADRGIIGVYSVRPEPKPVKNAVRLSGEAEPPDEPDSRYIDRRQLPGPTNGSRTQRAPVAVPKRIVSAPQPKPATSTPVPTVPAPAVPAPAVPAPVPVAAAAAPATEALLLQTIEKLANLMDRVERALSRPTNVMYQAGPVRSSGFTPSKKSGRIPQDVQTNTLHDIFQNNLDLRKSLDKLATTVGTPTIAASEKVPAPAAVGGNGANGQTGHGAAPGSGSGASVVSHAAAPASVRDGQSIREPAREIPKPVREPAGIGQKLAAEPQPV